MGGSDFLNNLKDAVESGEFNSDAAKKINEINEKADSFKNNKSIEDIKKSIDEKIEVAGVKKVDQDEITDLKSEYEEKMRDRAKEEIMYATIATLMNLEDELDQKIVDFEIFISKQEKQFDSEDEKFKDLFEKINELRNKYKFNEKE